MRRLIELFFAICLTLVLSWLILFLFLLSSLVFKCNGLFVQNRVGQNGKLFKIYKIRSLPLNSEVTNSYGRFIRKFKFDELPQLFNIILGDMTFVGPRPEVPEYFVEHQEYPKELLALKPGLTGLASLYFYNEDLRDVPSEEAKKLIFRKKNRLNRMYHHNNTVCSDMILIFSTIKRVFFAR